MARCPDCNKFTGKNVDEEPEVTNEPEIDSDGNITMSVKIVNQCEECSTPLEEYEFELEGKVEPDTHEGEDHILEIDEDYEVERTDSGGGRYAKRMFGVEAKLKVTCSCGDALGDVVVLKDEVASSAMESLV